MIKANTVKIKAELNKIDEMMITKQHLCKEDYNMLEKVRDDTNAVLYSLKIFFINRGDSKYNG